MDLRVGIVALAATGMAVAAFGKLLPVEIYEKGIGNEKSRDVDRSARYTVQERVREVHVLAGVLRELGLDVNMVPGFFGNEVIGPEEKARLDR